jgi:hypothetical protein
MKHRFYPESRLSFPRCRHAKKTVDALFKVNSAHQFQSRSRRTPAGDAFHTLSRGYTLDDQTNVAIRWWELSHKLPLMLNRLLVRTSVRMLSRGTPIPQHPQTPIGHVDMTPFWNKQNILFILLPSRAHRFLHPMFSDPWPPLQVRWFVRGSNRPSLLQKPSTRGEELRRCLKIESPYSQKEAFHELSLYAGLPSLHCRSIRSHSR